MKSLQGNDRSIALFAMSGHSLVHWFETSIPVFLVVWLNQLDASATVLGFVVMLGYAPFGLGALPGGVLADRFGPRPLILLCLLGMGASFVLLSFASAVPLLAVALLLWGVSASVYHPAGLSLISTGAEQRGSAFAWHGIAGNVGIALGPFVAATLLQFFAWQTVALLLAVPALLAFLNGLRTDFDPTAAVDVGEDESTTPLSLGDFLANSRTLLFSFFLLVFAIVAVEGMFYRGILTYLPEILQRLPSLAALELGAGLRGIEVTDYIYVGLLLAGIAGQYVGGKLTDRFSPSTGLQVLFVVLGVLALAFVPVSALGIAAILPYSVLLGVALFAIQPFYQDAAAVYTPADTRGLSYGYLYVGEFGIGALSVVIAGFLLDDSTLAPFFALLAGFALVGTVLSAGLYRYGRRG